MEDRRWEIGGALSSFGQCGQSRMGITAKDAKEREGIARERFRRESSMVSGPRGEWPSELPVSGAVVLIGQNGLCCNGF